MKKALRRLGIIGVGVLIWACLSVGSHSAYAKPPSFIEVGKIYIINFEVQWFRAEILGIDDCWATTRILEGRGGRSGLPVKGLEGYTVRLNLCSAWAIRGPFDAAVDK